MVDKTVKYAHVRKQQSTELEKSTDSVKKLYPVLSSPKVFPFSVKSLK